MTGVTFDAQPELRLATQGTRLGAFLLDIVLFGSTLGVGWLIWYLALAARGQSPGKQIVGIHVVYENGNQVGFWGMLQRDLVLRGFIFGGLFVVVFRYDPSASWYVWVVFALAALSCTWDEERQCLWDKVVGTFVVRTKSARPRVTAPSPVEPPPVEQSPVERMARNLELLEDLRARGLLTEEEYEERRKREAASPGDDRQSGSSP